MNNLTQEKPKNKTISLPPEIYELLEKDAKRCLRTTKAHLEMMLELMLTPKDVLDAEFLEVSE